jgi:23S rRNA pseudouridine2605 synthase
MARAVRVTVRSRSRGSSRLSLVLHTGWKRQVRRMCIAVGLKVTRLVRVRMGPLELGKLRPGEFRDLTKKEIDALTSPREQPRPRARQEGDRPAEPRVAGREPVGTVAPRVARRAPPLRTRVGPVESARRAAPPRAGSSRAGAEAAPSSRPWSAARKAGRPARERGPRAAAGPAARVGPARPAVGRITPARPPQWRRSTRAARGRAAPRRGPR